MMVTTPPGSAIERIGQHRVGLRMPLALEALDGIVE